MTTVLRKELLEAWRDRRSWIVVLLVPLLLTPLMPIGLTWFILRQNAGEPPTVFLENAAAAPVLSAAIRQIPGVTWATELPVQGQKADLYMKLPEGFERDLAQGATPTVDLRYDSSKTRATLAAALIRQFLSDFALEVGRHRLVEAGLDPAIVPRISVQTNDTSQNSATGAMLLSLMLPMMLAAAAAAGGIHAAVDTIAGEKERGTFEVLLTTPVPRMAVVAGKYLVAVLSSGLSLLATVGGLSIGILVSQHMAGAASEWSFSLPLWAAMLLLATGTVMATLFAALQLALSAMARSFKEAQSYTSPLALVPMLLTIVSLALDPGEAPAALFYVPMLNVLLVMRELLAQQLVVPHLVSSLGTTGLLTAIAMAWAARVLKRESILFRT